MRKHCIYLLFAFCTGILHAQTLDWENVFAGNANGSPQINDMKTDKEGNIIVAGQYGLDNTLNGKTLPKFNYIADEAFLAKFDASGRLLWMDTSSEYYRIEHIEISDKGDYFFSGSGPAHGAPFGAKPPIQNSEGFIGKCDPDGKIYWVRKYIDYHVGQGYPGIAYFKVDKSENVYFFNDLPVYPAYALIDTTKYYTLSSDNSAVFISKFDSNGNFNWLSRLYRLDNFPVSLDFDNNGNVYCLAPDSAYYTKTQACALYKFDKGGRLLKRIIMDSIDNSAGFFSLFTDNYNNVYIYGNVSDTMKFLGQVNTGSIYGFFARLDSNLNPLWILYQLDSGAVVNGTYYVNKNTGDWYTAAGYYYKATLAGYSTSNNRDDTFMKGNSGFNFYFSKIDSSGHVSWLENTTYSTVHNATVVDDACKNLYISFTYTKSLHYLGLNITNTTKRTYAGSAIAKFSLDVSFLNQHSACGLSLKNTSNPVYTQFQWYAKDTSDTTIGKLISTSRDLNYMFPHKHKYIITLLAIKSGGCTNTVQDTFSIPGSPVAGFTAIDTQGCQYVQFLFSDTSHADTINAALGQSWSWNFGDSASSGMNSRLTYSQTKRPIVSHVYTQSGIYTITLVYGNGLCTDTFTSQKKVVIIPAPKPGFTVSDTVGCAPLTVHVTDGSVGQVVGWVYVIKKIPLPPFPKGDSFRTSSFNFTFGEPGMYIIHQYLTGTTGCVTEDSVMVNVTPVFSATDSMDVSDVTVDSVAPPAIDIKWAAYPGAFNYELYRYTDKDTSTTVLLTQTYDTSYIDYNNLDPARHTYTYYLKAQDGCGNFTSAGLVGRTIKLSGSEGQDLLPSLAWNPYIQWKNGVKTYQVYRQNPGSNFTLLGSVADTFYTDTGFITDETYNDCYKVTALSKTDNYTSTSYIFCFSQSPQIFIPNIFTPNGDTLNDYFAPVCMGIKSYTMTIINRWGEKVYTTSFPAPSPLTSPQPAPGGEGAGWDGSFKGALSPNGIYIYYIKAEDYNGNTIIRKGMVMLQK